MRKLNYPMKAANVLIAMILLIPFFLFGQPWRYAGAPGFSAENTGYQHISFNPVEKIPYVAFITQHSLKSSSPSVMKFTGTGTKGWEDFGSIAAGDYQSRHSRLAFSPSGQIYLAYIRGFKDVVLSVMTFDPASGWVPVGSPEICSSPGPVDLEVSPAGAQEPCVALLVQPNQVGPYRMQVLKYSALKGWEDVPPGAPYPVEDKDGSSFPQMAIDSHGNIYIASVVKYKGGTYIKVLKFNGQWNYLTKGEPWCTRQSNLSLALHPDDELPVVAFRNEDNRNTEVYKYNGSRWIRLGDPVQIAQGTGQVLATSLFDHSLNLALMQPPSNCITVMKWNGIEWAVTGDPCFSGPADGGYLGFAMAPDADPFVAFSDQVYNAKTSVMHFPPVPPEKQLSSYTILGYKEVQLGEANHVQSGWVGLTMEGFQAHFKKNSSVYPGTVKADDIVAHPTAYLPNVMDGPAEVTLPDMKYSDGSGSEGSIIIPDGSSPPYITANNVDIVIGSNCNVEIRSRWLGNITIGSGSKVSFNEIDLHLVGLTLQKASVNLPTVVTFTKLAQVKVKEKVDIGEYCTLKSFDQQKFPMALFIGEADGGHQGNMTVHAEGAAVLAGAFVPRGQIHVISKASPARPCVMTGQFIAEKVNSGAGYVNWNLVRCFTEGTQPVAPVRPVVLKDGNSASKDTGLRLEVFPSPGDGLITARIFSPADGRVILTAFNQLGMKVYHADRITTGRSTDVKIDLRNQPPGIYFLRMTVRQGEALVQRFLIIQ